MIEPTKFSINSLITERSLSYMNRGWFARLWYRITDGFPKKAINLDDRLPEGVGLEWNEITLKQLERDHGYVPPSQD